MLCFKPDCSRCSGWCWKSTGLTGFGGFLPFFFFWFVWRLSLWDQPQPELLASARGIFCTDRWHRLQRDSLGHTLAFWS